MTTEFRDIINVYQAKRREVEETLKNSFFLFVNAPDDNDDRQGYLCFGSPLKFETERYELFRYFIVGARAADIRDMEELIAYGDSEARTEYSEEGDDYHAIVGARTVSEYLKIILRHPDEPIGLATEVLFRDESGELITVHYDGEYDRVQLDRKVWWKFLGGSHDPEVIRTIMAIADRNLKEKFHPDQLDGLLDELRRTFPMLGCIHFWKINFVIEKDPEPEPTED